VLFSRLSKDERPRSSSPVGNFHTVCSVRFALLSLYLPKTPREHRNFYSDIHKLALPPPPSTSIIRKSSRYLSCLLLSYPCPNPIYSLIAFLKTLKSIGFYFFNFYILLTIYFLTLIEPVSEMGPSSKINFPSLISFFIGLFSNLFFLLNSFFDCHFFSHCFPLVPAFQFILPHHPVIFSA